MKQLCKCGCGQVVKEGNTYMNGHWWRGKHRISNRKGKHHSNETKELLRVKMKAMWNNNYYVNKMSPSDKIRQILRDKSKILWQNQNHREMMAKAARERWQNKEYRKKNIKGIRKAARTKEHREKLREIQKALWLNESFRNKRTQEIRKAHTEESDKKRRKTMLKMWKDKKFREKSIRGMKNLWKNKEYKERALKAILKGSQKRPTSFEKQIIDLCNKYHLPFKYVGNGQVIIANKNPDFIDVNGRKLLIETYCKYWKDRKCGGWLNYEKERYKVFAEYGFKTLFLNEDDLIRDDNEQHCLNKIKEVIRGVA